MPAPAKKDLCDPSDHDAAERLLSGESTKPAVDDERALVTPERAPLVRHRGRQNLHRNDVFDYAETRARRGRVAGGFRIVTNASKPKWSVINARRLAAPSGLLLRSGIGALEFHAVKHTSG